jgi:protein TonB
MALTIFTSCSAPPSYDPPANLAPTRPDFLCAALHVRDDQVQYDREPELISMPEPQYPEQARARNEEGTVLCHVFIDATGRVIEAHVLQASTAALNNAAVIAARGAIFKPARRKDGTTVAVWMVIPIEFSVRN